MMVPHTRLVSSAVLLMSSVLCFAQLPQESRITRPVDPTQTVRLVGSAHPLAKPELARERLNGNTTLHGVSLIFGRSPTQQKALEKLLEAQQNPASPQYHKWLTPEQFADRFGLTSSDVAQIKNWLESEGFRIDSVARSRTQIAFSGTVARIESVFRTEIVRFTVSGKRHFANAGELSIPAALADVIVGVRNLNDFHPTPRNTGRRRIPASPEFTSSISGNHYLVPRDFATIYDVTPLYEAGFDGTGEKIAVVGDSDITMSNIERFRSLSGLPANDPTKVLVPNSGTATVPSTNEQMEAYLDLEWSGAVAKNATVIYVYVGNNANYSVWDALQYAVDKNVAPIISTSFGYCEAGLGQGNVMTIQGWAQQANSQGQTIVAASGDSGAADCDGSEVQSATQGLAVDVPAAIPEVTGIGGSEFTGDASSTSATTYWNGTNDSVYGSALSYIPEEVWNDTSESIANQGGLAAGGGGASTYFSKPSWQTGTGIPDGHRDVPDVSLNASPFHDSFLICDGTDSAGDQSCTNGFRDSQNYLATVGGTSAGAPSFAGILALINQATGSKGLGNVNSMLYSLAASASNSFHDITSGDNKVPCVKGSTNCPSGGTIGYSAGTGYDQASGLGSVDVFNLATSWPGYAATPNYSVSANPPSVTISSAGETATSTITVRGTGGFGGAVNLSCTVSSSTAKIGCAINPSSVSIDSTTTSATATLRITTAAPSVVEPPKFSQIEGSFAVIACVGLFGISAWPRYRRPRLSLFSMIALTMFCIGCGGSGSGGTPKGSYTVTATGKSGTQVHKAFVSVSVE